MRAIQRVVLNNSLKAPFPCCSRWLARRFSSDCRRMDKRQENLIDSKHDLDALHRFISGRWLWNEPQQLAARYLKFDVTALLKLAATSIGSESCVKVVKISEGQYNKVFQLTMNDDREVIAKLPNPNAGRPHFTTASEVATMDFLRNTLLLPVPKIHAWSSRASDNPVGAEYIIMEKQTGMMLSDVWQTMRGKQKTRIVQQVVDLEKTLTSTKFTKLGALYYKQDLPSSPDHGTVLYVDGTGNEVHTEKFGVGPTNHRSFFDFGKGELDIDRGPWSTTTGYLEAVAYREMACVDAGLSYPVMPEGLFSGPGQYQPSASKKLSALHNYLKLAPYVLPENKETHAPVLWHGDLHLQNIFVDSTEPTQIVGIIDWQSISICPLFMQATMPGFLEYNGPIPEKLERISLPSGFDSMTPDEQQKAKELQQAQTLHNLYLALSRQINSTAFQAIKGQATLRHQISVVPGLTITDSEPCLTGLLREVEKKWSIIVGERPDDLPSIPCPLQFSAAEVKQQEHDEKLWAQGVDLMSDFVSETGCFKHWDGRVSNEDYEVSRRQLAEGIERFLSREARDQEGRKAWLKALPFVD